ncbi:MAG: 5-formyltetrahydrofolate cyclo-ligase [Lachnospiraceae bacterium]|nr:5-formyltetrahydrofolate cyclo-ligase [Lachnospiraceae bacterium]
MVVKQEMRRKYLTIRDSLSEAEVNEKSRLIIKKLTALDIYQKADIILTYIDFRNEVLTTGLVAEILKQKEKRVFCPKVVTKMKDKSFIHLELNAAQRRLMGVGREIAFYEIKALTELAAGYQGIREPVVKDGPAAIHPGDNSAVSINDFLDSESDNCLMIMPGVVFDGQRGRIGYGKGFYDRFLASYPKLKTVALAYEFQIVSSVPKEDNDVCPDMILTELRIIK